MFFLSSTPPPTPLPRPRPAAPIPLQPPWPLPPQSSQLKKVNIDFSCALQLSSFYYLITCLKQDLEFYVDLWLTSTCLLHTANALEQSAFALCRGLA